MIISGSDNWSSGGSLVGEDVQNVLDPFNRIMFFSPRTFHPNRTKSNKETRTFWNPFARSCFTEPSASAAANQPTTVFGTSERMSPILEMSEVTLDDLRKGHPPLDGDFPPSAPALSAITSHSQSECSSYVTPESSFDASLRELNSALQFLHVEPLFEANITQRGISIVRKQMQRAVDRLQSLFWPYATRETLF